MRKYYLIGALPIVLGCLVILYLGSLVGVYEWALVYLLIMGYLAITIPPLVLRAGDRIRPNKLRLWDAIAECGYYLKRQGSVIDNLSKFYVKLEEFQGAASALHGSFPFLFFGFSSTRIVDYEYGEAIVKFSPVKIMPLMSKELRRLYRAWRVGNRHYMYEFLRNFCNVCYHVTGNSDDHTLEPPILNEGNNIAKRDLAASLGKLCGNLKGEPTDEAGTTNSDEKPMWYRLQDHIRTLA